MKWLLQPARRWEVIVYGSVASALVATVICVVSYNQIAPDIAEANTLLREIRDGVKEMNETNIIQHQNVNLPESEAALRDRLRRDMLRKKGFLDDDET